jgi:hypothetical protein
MPSLATPGYPCGVQFVMHTTGNTKRQVPKIFPIFGRRVEAQNETVQMTVSVRKMLQVSDELPDTVYRTPNTK